MRGHVKTKIFQWLAKLGFAAAAFLLACSGGGGTGGPGGAGPVGSSLDTANFAGGPVSISSPDTVSSDGFEINRALISCKNIVPEVLCRGSVGSVPTNANLRLSVYAPGDAGGQVINGPVNTTADAEGAWMQMIPASTGQVIGICLMKNNLCAEVLYLTVPPPGQEVDGIQGIMNHLTLDPQGNILFSKNAPPQPKVKKGWSWTSLFISEAHADDGSGSTSLYIQLRPSMIYNVMNAEPTAEGSGEGDGGIIRLPKFMVADCPRQPAEMYGIIVNREEIVGNQAKILRINKDSPDKLELVMAFPSYARADIHDMESYSYGGSNWIAAAIDSKVFLLKDGESATLEATINMPAQFIVTQLFDMGGYLAAVVGPRPGSSEKPAYPIYWIEKDFNKDKVAWCMPPNKVVAHLDRVVQLNGFSQKFAGVGQKADGSYVAFVGSPMIYSDLSDFKPIVIQSSANPLEAVLLRVSDSEVTVAVLNAKEKWIKFIRYNRMPGSPPLEEVQWDLNAKVSGLNYPHHLQFTTSGTGGEMAFLDITDSGSRIVSMPYKMLNGLPMTVHTLPIIYPLGNLAPSIFRRLGNSWVYNTSGGSIRRVENRAQQLGIDPSDLSISGEAGEGLEKETRRDRLTPELGD